MTWIERMKRNQHVVRLREKDGLSFMQIAERLNLTPSRVCQLYKKAQEVMHGKNE